MPRRGRSAVSDRIDDQSTQSTDDKSGYSSYGLPPLVRRDTIDELVKRVDQGGMDKYRAREASSQLSSSIHQDVMSVSTIGSPSEASAVDVMSISDSNKTTRLLESWADDDFYPVKQTFGYLSIGISALQLLVLMMQLALCGVAPLDVNPMIGPYPDTFSEWGGKNSYLMVVHNQWWRLVSPAFLHVGLLQLLLNAYVQLETCAFFEREWGSFKWLCLYIISEIGCIATSCAANPDTIAVGSSGALMGLFGAKVAHVMSHTFFEVASNAGESIQLEQLSGVMCSLVLVLSLSFFTYIDWSGHMGGLGVGFCAGMMAFSKPIRNQWSRLVWRLLGMAGLVGGLFAAFFILLTKTELDEDLEDACAYFRNLFSEGYDCQCFI